MTDDRPSDGDVPGEDPPNDGDEATADDPPGDADDRSGSRGFHLEAGLRPLKDLLGNLVEVTVTDAPPPPDETADWSSVEDSSRRPLDESDRTPPAERPSPDRSSADAEYLVDTRRENGEFVVTADVPGASKSDLSVGIDPRTNELVIGVDGTVVERVDPPWRSVEASKVWFNNGVLEVGLRPTDPVT